MLHQKGNNMKRPKSPLTKVFFHKYKSRYSSIGLNFLWVIRGDGARVASVTIVFWRYTLTAGMVFREV